MSEPLRVLGLDPGSRHTGWGVVDCLGSELSAVGWGRISPPATSSLGERLSTIADGIETVLRQHRPAAAAIERVFHGQNSRSLIVLAEARGAILLTLERFAVPIVEIAATRVKSAVAGSGSAGKDQVARMVRLLLGLGDERLPVDASDALAVAIAGGQSARQELLRPIS